jgi:hypothetical protein
MPSVDPFDPGNDIWAAIENSYWRTVARTLDVVFHANAALAWQFRHRLLDVSPLERALFLHDDPLYVAASLAGLRVTKDHIRAFSTRVLNKPERGK